MDRELIDLDEFPKLVENSPRLSTVHFEGINYADFFENALHANQLYLIKSVSQGWKSQEEWIFEGRPNFDVLQDKYGMLEVPVAMCNERYFNAQSKKTMIFNDYLAYFKGHVSDGYPVDDCLYLKDWHLARQCPDDHFYEVPKIFASDWLNEYLVEGNSNADDYRFVYMGPKGSWTPFHADVFSSFSWSVNLCGRKKWVFYSPGKENHLRDVHNELVYDVNSEELFNSKHYPNFSPSTSFITVIQEQGDAIFVPSGWHHQVWNLDDTISINHNWINACNVRYVWKALLDCQTSVQREIESCRDMNNWDEHCQLMVKSCFGMDFMGFFDMLRYIAEIRLERLKSGRTLRVLGWEMGRNHMRYDLKVLLEVLIDMTNEMEGKTERLKSLVDEIKEIEI